MAEGQTRREVDLSVHPAGSIEVRVAKADGTPAGGYVVVGTFEGESDDPLEPARGFVGPSGSATLTGCAEGKWQIRLTPIGFGEEAPPAPEPQVVEVVPGEKRTVEFSVE